MTHALRTNASGHAPPILALTLVLALSACGGDAGAAPADLQVDTIGTVEYFRHGAPVSADTLGPLLTVGRAMAVEAGAPDEFGRITSIALGPDANLYVSDSQAAEIRVFSPGGEFLRTFGRSGGGPGEFLALYSLAFLGDTLLAMDSGNARIALLDLSGRPLATWPWYPLTGPANVVRFYPAAAGEVYTLDLRSGPGPQGPTYARLTTAGPGDTLSHPPPVEDPPRTSPVCPGSDGSIAFFSVPFGAQQIAVPAPDGLLASAWSSDYRIALTRPSGDTLRVIERDYVPLPISDEEWEAGTREFREFRERSPGTRCTPEGLERPAHKAALQGVYFDEGGRMVVEVTAEGMTRYDFYDLEGRAMETVFAPPRDPQTVPYFREGRIAQVVRDGMDVQGVQLLQRRGRRGQPR